MQTKDQSLPPDVLNIVRHRATEFPNTGEYDAIFLPGTYLCRACGMALFRSDTKFNAGCGWPSFDGALIDRVQEQADADGQRTEIVCRQCQAHLGHVFTGEGFTARNMRHCVNSKSLDFVKDTQVLDTEEALFAGGCFWGVQYLLDQLPGVLKTEVGYLGGHVLSPTYDNVCTGTSGHYEAVRVLYDPEQLSYTKLVQYFFEIHDPTQADGQGPDRGPQYQSAIFYYDDHQKRQAEDMMQILRQKGLSLATQLLPVTTFWSAETYHQAYYQKHHQQPYCHRYTKRF